MLQNFLKLNKGHFFAIIGFVVISAVVYLPAMQGYAVKQGDISSHKGMAKELRDYRAETGEEAIWSNGMFSGMPGYQTNVVYDNGVKDFFFKIIGLGLPHPVNFTFISLLGFFFLGRVLKANILLSFLGAVMYTFVTYNVLILEAGHNTKMLVISYFPAILAAFLMVYRSKKIILSFALLALMMGLQFAANHTQMTYYFIFVLIAVGINEFIVSLKSKTIPSFAKRTGIAILAVGVGFISNFGSFNDTLSFAKETMRGGNVITVKPGNIADQLDSTPVKKTSGLSPDYITYWSYGKQETYNFFVPNAKGSNSKTNEMFEELGKINRNLPSVVYKKYQQAGGKGFGGYWGDQPGTSGPNYIGAIAVFLALLYILLVHTSMKWSLLGVSFLVLLLGWGKNLGGLEDMWLTNFFIQNVPLYSKFRVVASFLVIINFTVPLMAILFLKKLITDQEWAKKNMKTIGITGGVIALVILFLSFSPNVFDFTNQVENKTLATYTTTSGIDAPLLKNSLVKVRQSIFKADSLRTVGFVLVTLLLLLLGASDKVKFKFLLPALIALVLFDLFNVNNNYFNNEKTEQNVANYQHWQKKDGSQNINRATEGDMAIYNLETSRNKAITQEVNQRIQTERANLGSKFSVVNQESIMFSTLNFNTNYKVMDVDNPFNSSRASYFHKSTGGYHPAKLRRYQDMIDFYIGKEINFINSNQLEKMKVLNMLNNKYYLYQGKLIISNQYAYGNAWFVNDIKWVEDNNQEILSIEETDITSTAIIHNEFKNLVKDVSGKDSNATIFMESYQPNHIRYNSKSNQDQLAVFSEVYYKDGWNAYIDGELVPHGRANYILRTLNVPKGEHMIDFKFEPAQFKMGNTINMIGFFIILIALLLSIFFWYKNDLPQLNQTIDEE